MSDGVPFDWFGPEELKRLMDLSAEEDRFDTDQGPLWQPADEEIARAESAPARKVNPSRVTWPPLART